MVSKDVIRYLRTTNLYLSYFGLGLAYSVNGPTLLDLEKNVQSTTQEVAYIFAARSAGYLGGSILGGIMFDNFNRQVLLIGCFILIGFTNLMVALSTSLLLLICVMVVAGLAMGAMDTGGTVWCLDLWTVNPAPYIQALHFFYGSGAFVGPLIAEPFLSSDIRRLSEDDQVLSIENNTMISINNQTSTNDGNVVMPYAIISTFLLVITVSSLISYCLDGTELKSNTEKPRPTTIVKDKNLPRLLILFALLCVMCYLGVENTYPQFLTTYLVKGKLGLSKSTGSFMTSVFWFFFCVTRGLAILGATKVSPFAMLLTNVVIINACGAVLSVWGESSVSVMWVCSGLLGMGTASTWASLFAWLEMYIGISNNISCLFVVFASIGGLTMTLVVGSFIENIPNGVLYTVSLGGVGCLASVLGMRKVVGIIKNNAIIISRRNTLNSSTLNVPFKEVRFEKESYPDTAVSNDEANAS